MTSAISFRRKLLNEYPTSLHPRETGLPFKIWITRPDRIPKTRARSSTRPRLKVYESAIRATVSVDQPIEILEGSLPPNHFKSLARYIKLNRMLLTQLWQREIDDFEFVLHQQPLKKSKTFLRQHSKEMTSAEFVMAIKKVDGTPATTQVARSVIATQS